MIIVEQKIGYTHFNIDHFNTDNDDAYEPVTSPCFLSDLGKDLIESDKISSLVIGFGSYQPQSHWP